MLIFNKEYRKIFNNLDNSHRIYSSQIKKKFIIHVLKIRIYFLMKL